MGVEQIHVFDNNMWNNPMQNIRIFDSKYVRQNVHTEEAVLDDHQTKLETLILGRSGKTLSDNLAEAERAAKENSQGKTNITNEYNRFLSAKTGITFPRFLELEPDADIQTKIEEQKKQIDSYRKYDNIKHAIAELKTKLDSYDLSQIESVLEPTLDLHQEVLNGHIHSNLKHQ